MRLLPLFASLLCIVLGVAIALGDRFALGNVRDIIFIVIGALLALDGVLGLIGSLKK